MNVEAIPDVVRIEKRRTVRFELEKSTAFKNSDSLVVNPGTGRGRSAMVTYDMGNMKGKGKHTSHAPSCLRRVHRGIPLQRSGPQYEGSWPGMCRSKYVTGRYHGRSSHDSIEFCMLNEMLMSVNTDGIPLTAAVERGWKDWKWPK
jgi:hypothetical protein